MNIEIIWKLYKITPELKSAVKYLRIYLRKLIFGNFMYNQIKIRNKSMLLHKTFRESICHRFIRILYGYPPLYHYDFSPVDNEDRNRILSYIISTFMSKYYAYGPISGRNVVTTTSFNRGEHKADPPSIHSSRQPTSCRTRGSSSCHGFIGSSLGKRMVAVSQLM